MDKNFLNRLLDLWKSALKFINQLISGPGRLTLGQLLIKYSPYGQFEDKVWVNGIEQFQSHWTYSINSLEFFGADDRLVEPDDNLVLVLVEKRLLNEQPAILKQRVYDNYSSLDENWIPSAVPPAPETFPFQSGNFDLRHSLSTLRADITKHTPCDFDWQDAPKNYTASVIVADVYAGELRRDGQTLLALRDFLKEVKGAYPNFRGVILVGAFPEALLIRKWGTSASNKTAIAAYRSDIVLADLNGCWDSVFCDQRERFPIDTTHSATRAGLFNPDASYEASSFFLITDFSDMKDIKKKVEGKNYGFYDPEVGKEDLLGIGAPGSTRNKFQGLLFRIPLAETDLVMDSPKPSINVLNKPDIGINSQGKYYNTSTGEPYPDLYDKFCHTLNESGFVNLENPIAYPEILVSRINARNIARSRVEEKIMLDPYLERELLIEYFKRNHDYRTGELKPKRGLAAVACNREDEDQEYQPVDLRAAFAESQAGYGGIKTETAVPIWSRKNCTPGDFDAFLNQDAVLRSMLLHGDFVSLQLRNGDWDFKRWRARWEQRDPANLRAAFYWNTACFSNAPIYCEESPYNFMLYGFGMPADCMLFYGDGLAVLSQSHQTGSWPGKHPDPAVQKSPPGGSFEWTLRMRRTFGEAWRSLYDDERNNPDLNIKEDRRKDVYIWGVVGDWTLRLNKR